MHPRELLSILHNCISLIFSEGLKKPREKGGWNYYRSWGRERASAKINRSRGGREKSGAAERIFGTCRVTLAVREIAINRNFWQHYTTDRGIAATVSGATDLIKSFRSIRFGLFTVLPQPSLPSCDVPLTPAAFSSHPLKCVCLLLFRRRGLAPSLKIFTSLREGCYFCLLVVWFLFLLS